jgi:hypothetical protein
LVNAFTWEGGRKLGCNFGGVWGCLFLSGLRAYWRLRSRKGVSEAWELNCLGESLRRKAISVDCSQLRDGRSFHYAISFPVLWYGTRRIRGFSSCRYWREYARKSLTVLSSSWYSWNRIFPVCLIPTEKLNRGDKHEVLG